MYPGIFVLPKYILPSFGVPLVSPMMRHILLMQCAEEVK
uniref:Uncharacterized protein n=1 Tax=Rhizophora mucronata TaxID=61149 RepID=A0A2P2LL12_RHIMU